MIRVERVSPPIRSITQRYENFCPGISFKHFNQASTTGQSRRHLTGNAFALLAGYHDTEKLYKFIPCDMAFD